MILEEHAERGMEVGPQRDVRDLLRLLKMLEFQEEKRKRDLE